MGNERNAFISFKDVVVGSVQVVVIVLGLYMSKLLAPVQQSQAVTETRLAGMERQLNGIAGDVKDIQREYVTKREIDDLRERVRALEGKGRHAALRKP